MRGLFLLAAILAATPSLASTSSGWIDTDAAEKMAKQMREERMRLIDLDCRPDTSKADERSAFLMTWEPNTDNRQWSWREAAAAVVQDYKRDFAGKGFRLVVERSFVMPSGKKRACALWQKSSGKDPVGPGNPPPNR